MSDMIRLFAYYEDAAKEAERPEEVKQYNWLARLVLAEIKKEAEA